VEQLRFFRTELREDTEAIVINTIAAVQAPNIAACRSAVVETQQSPNVLDDEEFQDFSANKSSGHRPHR
jgi:hypothetical protein